MPELGFIAVTYGHSLEQLEVFTSSLLLQTVSNWKCLIIHDGKDESWFKTKANLDAVLETYPDKFQLIGTETRFNDWGQTLRLIGTGLMNSDYLQWTNCDNYYLPRCVERWNLVMNAGVDLGLAPILHSHYQDKVFIPQPMINGVDFINFIVKTELARQVPLKSGEYAADGIFVQDLQKFKPDLRIGRVEQIVAVHN